MKDKVLFEVCCGCFEDAVQAEKGGADRIELNSALFLGGLTPSIGTVQAVKNTLKIPVMCMVRPREGGFCYTDFDYETCCRDMEALLNDFIGKIKKINPNAEIVFHRAIDVVPDVFKALDDLINLGVTRILTSGQRESAIKGAKTVKKMIEYASDRIDILPGGGINTQNVGEFINETGTHSVHASARSLRHDTSVCGNPEIFFGGKLNGVGIP